MNQNDCQNIFKLLSEYIDGELPAGTCEDLERHIQGCAPCVEFMESLKKSVELGRKYAPDVAVPPVPEALREALRAAYAKSIEEHPVQPDRARPIE